MSPELREDIVEIEYLLCAKMRPIFLAISTIEEDIQIVISCIAFDNMSVQTRISSIFYLLSHYSNVILEERLIVVSAFNSDEMDIVLNDLFTEELK